MKNPASATTSTAGRSANRGAATAARKSTTVTSATAKKAAAKKAPASKSPAKSAPKATATKTPAKTTAKAAARKSVPAKSDAAKKPATTKPVAKKAPVSKPVAAKTAKKAAKAAPAKKAPAPRKAAPTKSAAATKSSGPAKSSAATKASASRAARAAAASLLVGEDESPWTPSELASVAAELRSDVERLEGEVAHFEHDFTDLIRGGGDGAGDDQADVGTMNVERDHELSLADNSRAMLEQSRHALERIADGSYGICESCGKAVGKLRLQAFPRATLCMACKQKQERR